MIHQLTSDALVFPYGDLIGLFPCGNGRGVALYGNTDAEQFLSYVTKLSEQGFSLVAENTVGDNLYRTLVKDDLCAHTYYTAFDRTVRVIVEPVSRALLPADFEENGEEGEKVTDTTLSILAPDYSHREILDGNGMGYVILLADGRYVIMDGGYAQDANRLYNFLAERNPRADGTIVIAAWIFTHAHGDHYGAFVRFTEKYASRVTLERAIFSPSARWQFRGGRGYDPFFSEGLHDRLASYGAVKKITPHAGQVFRLCDATFTVYYTGEDTLPGYLPYMNDSSVVLRMTVGGQSVLFMGDCEKSTSDLIAKIHGDALRSDFLQINHHGYSGGTVKLYELVAPTYSMWPTSRAAFEMRITGEKYKWIGNAIESNHYIATTIGKENCFVADEAITLIRFPLASAKDVTRVPADDTDRSAL